MKAKSKRNARNTTKARGRTASSTAATARSKGSTTKTPPTLDGSLEIAVRLPHNVIRYYTAVAKLADCTLNQAFVVSLALYALQDHEPRIPREAK